MYYQHPDKKAWLGPVKVFVARGNDVFIFANGSMSKIPRCNVRSCEAEESELKNEETNVEAEKEEGKVRFEEQRFGDNIREEDIEIADRRVTRLMTDVQRRVL